MRKGPLRGKKEEGRGEWREREGEEAGRGGAGEKGEAGRIGRGMEERLYILIWRGGHIVPYV
jgi:hypothetical protein